VLNGQEVEEITKVCRSKRYELIQDGRFPKPINLLGRNNGWLASEIDAWIAERVAERDAKI